MHEKIAGSHLRIFTGSGHMSAMEQSEQVNAAMGQFLGRC
jgi:pimeloyl-ACP methyl ester carboxylesterase